MDQQEKHKRRHLKDLLQQYLREDISPYDKQIIEKWLAQQESSQMGQPTVEERIGEEVLQRIQAKLDQAERNSPRKLWPFKPVFRFAGAAAIFLLLGFAVYIFQQRQSSINIERVVSQQPLLWDSVITAPGQRLKMRLPDSSIVYIHGNSKLRYLTQLNARVARRVYLDKGEAFFEVSHRPDQPFVVQTKQANNTVLGTSFNIKLQGDDGLYHLSVNTGAVEFTANKDNTLRQIVSKGNHLIFDENGAQIRVAVARPTDFSAWKDNVLVLDNNNWLQVNEKLHNWFGVQLHVSPKLTKQHYFTATFEAATLKKVLSGLQHINHFDYEIRGKEVFIE